MKKLLTGLSALMLLTNVAIASFHVEPYVGYAKGEEDTSDANPDDYTGMGFGARIGYNYLGLLVGATYDSQGITASSTEPGSTDADSDFTGTNMGAFLGYEFPIGFRLWLSYYASAKFELDNGLAAGAEFSGSGYSVGAGYSVIPMILSVNFEMKSFDYDELTLANGTTSTVNNAGASYMMLSISAPLSF